MDDDSHNMAERPTVITIICILVAILGILMLMSGLMFLTVKNSADLIGPMSEYSVSLINAIGAGYVIIGLLSLVVAFLLWTGKTIGWYLAIIYLIINAVLSIFSIFVRDYTGVINLIIMGILIWYFFQPHVKKFYSV